MPLSKPRKYLIFKSIIQGSDGGFNLNESMNLKPMKSLLGIGVLILLVNSSCATLKKANSTVTTIGFAKSPRSAKFAPDFLAPDNYKFQTTSQVFTELLRGWGDHRIPAPTLVMNKGRQSIAWMDPVNNEIGVEERAYDICSQMGADSLNALAALLAHEIIHYYYFDQSELSKQFADGSPNNHVADPKKELQISLDFEAQADYLGGILAFSAGYNTYDVFSNFMKQAYERYGLPEDIKGYPSFTERLNLNLSTADSLRKMHAVYQMANLLTLVGEHQTATEYYKHILETYQSFEVYNNAGVNASLAALALMEPTDFGFALPLELDINSRLDELVTRLPDDAAYQRQILLADAEKWFQKTQVMAPQDAIGSLNLSIVYLLQNRSAEAQRMSQQALEIAQANRQTKTLADIQILQGILAAQAGDTERARQQFQAALADSPELAQVNLAVLNQSKSNLTQQKAAVKGVELIEGIFLDDFLSDPQIKVTAELETGTFCGKTILPQSTIFMHYAKAGSSYAIFHETTENYPQSTNWEISLGATLAEVRATYKAPDKMLGLKDGTCLVYEDLNILFIFNEQQKLKKWVTFRKALALY